MKKKILFTVAIIMLLAGISLVMFAPVSNFVGTSVANSQADDFDTQVKNIQKGSYQQALKDNKIDKQGYPIDKNGNRTSNKPYIYKVDLDGLYKVSVKYNEDLKTTQSIHLINENAYAHASINLQDYGIFDGIYGYVSAKTINMKLPIYLGANASTMSYGAAHLSYTSLPLGGDSTNTVLAGHTGYIGRIFFDNLKNLKINDTVSVTNYWYTVNYKVTQTKVLKPNQSSDIYIQKGKSLLTLITCTSNGKGGFDRYYVICEQK